MAKASAGTGAEVSLIFIFFWGGGRRRGGRGSEERERGVRYQVEVKEVERFEEFRHARQAKEGEDKGSVPSLSVARLSFFLPLNALSSCASRFGTCSRRALSGEGRASEHTSDAARGRGGGDSLDAANEKKASRVVLAKRRIRQPILSRLLSTHNSLPILTSCTGARAEHACAGS